MSGSEPWVIRGVVYIVLVLTPEVIFEKGIASCTGYQLPRRLNSSTQTGNSNPPYEFLNPYFRSVLGKSTQPEEAIYSDVINNIRALINEGGRSESTGIRGKGWKKPADESANYTNTEASSGSHASDVFLSSSNDFINEKGREYVFQNYTAIDYGSPNEHEYLLGYSGNPFGSRNIMPGIASIDGEGIPEESQSGGMPDPRKKRSVLHLYNMVLCATGCNPFSYKGYGCYCGFLGSGFVVDGIDSCCKLHDWCYNNAGCPTFLEYFIPYLWKCYHRQPHCAISHGYYGGPGSCAQRLCECDRQLALCLRKYPCPNTKALCTSSPWRLLQNILML